MACLGRTSSSNSCKIPLLTPPFVDRTFLVLGNPPTGFTLETSTKTYAQTVLQTRKARKNTRNSSRSLMTRERKEQFDHTAMPKVTSFPATCAHVVDTHNGPAPCFDKMRSRGIQTGKIFGDPFREDNNLRYIKVSANCADQNSFHGSYETLLTILADRIEMKPMDLQTKVNKLENALFFRKSLHGVL